MHHLSDGLQVFHRHGVRQVAAGSENEPFSSALLHDVEHFHFGVVLVAE